MTQRSAKVTPEELEKLRKTFEAIPSLSQRYTKAERIAYAQSQRELNECRTAQSFAQASDPDSQNSD